jgi:hypothetical protein
MLFSKYLWISLLAATAFAADETPALKQARLELERIQSLVNAGALPASRISEAQKELDDASDEAVLEKTLYGRIEVADLTEEQGEGMTAAATRRVERQVQKVTALMDKPLRI